MKTNRTIIVALATAAALALSGAAQAKNAAHDHASHGAAAASSARALPLVKGEVRRIDKAAGKLTIKHGPIPNLDMPAMTMVYVAKDAAMLGRVKVGDQIKFSAETLGGVLTVTRIEH